MLYFHYFEVEADRALLMDDRNYRILYDSHNVHFMSLFHNGCTHTTSRPNKTKIIAHRQESSQWTPHKHSQMYFMEVYKAMYFPEVSL